MAGYNPQAIEKKWQQRWAVAKVFAAPNLDAGKPKFYVLDMFPYPSGQGLHVGHPEGYTATDIIARYKRARGFAVMHPMGWDAFGLPAEQYAIKNGVHPRQTTAANVMRFRTQLQSLGFSYDWDREVDTTDPGYYQWTQWIFLTLFDTWFDEAARRGRPISELVEEFRSGKRQSQNARGESCRWEDLSPTEQRRILSQHRLAYEAQVPVNWCPGLGTVLANEEVIDGRSEVGGYPVERRPMKQWMLRITAYAERLLEGLDGLEWSDSLKEMQRNWIGRSDGAEVDFVVEGAGKLTVFTTRPDTLFGATYMVVAPEHPLVERIVSPDRRTAVDAYRHWAQARSDRERQEDTRKTGEFTGAFAVNPVNGAKIPIWVSDYVLMGYGTGAIMAVPGHDQRDHEFALKFQLPIVQVVKPLDGRTLDIQKESFVEEGLAVNSPWIEGLPTAQANARMIAMLQEKGLGVQRVNYRIRDWLFSRQRYWGEPFPIVHLEDGSTVRLSDTELPVVLPELEDFKPTGSIEPPLSKARDWWDIHVLLDDDHVARVVPSGTPGAIRARRELNTMPQWAGSCWYFIRYLDPHNRDAMVDAAAERYWLHDGVDLYVGGVEHAVLHLLYSRFWHKVLYDRGLVSCDEPFRRLVNQGLILGEAEFTVFRTQDGTTVSYADVLPEFQTQTVTLDGEEVIQTVSRHRRTGELLVGAKVEPSLLEKGGEGFVLKADPSIRVDSRSFKMSKSRGNVVNPDDVVRDYGADSLRMFEMFMGPLEQVKPWSTAGVEGVYRFLQRVWRNFFDEEDRPRTRPAPDPALVRPLHRLIKKVTEDIERMSFNTAIAAMMEFNNSVGRAGGIDRDGAMTFIRLLEPFAPHFAEEVHERLGGTQADASADSVSRLPWPAWDPAMLVESTIEIPVQVNGKLRSRITVPHDADEAVAVAAALADREVRKFVGEKELRKKIYVKGRMVNLVV